MKIIAKDNYDRETVSDFVVAENVNEHYGATMVSALNNKHSGEHAPRFFVLESDDYVPYKFEP